jgi:hypothetical protein
MGRRSEAAAHYQRLTDELKKDGRTPSADTQSLYKDIMT